MPWRPGLTGNKGPAQKVKHLSPAMKIALKALILGAAKTNKEAGKISGLHPAYIGSMRNTQLGNGFMQAHEDKVDEKLIETSALMDLLGREALSKMGGLMRFSADEQIVLRASADLMDRSPVTMKIHKAQVESFTLSGKDAKEIAAAMVESQRMRELHDAAADGDFVKIPSQVEVRKDEEEAA